MSDERDSGGGEEAQGVDEQAGQMQMQLFSTWEVRKVPANCVARLCTLTVTRLRILRSLEPGQVSVVLAVSMKTPHRSLRSNEIALPPNGLLDIPLQLTFSLQYPHFIKRGGNTLQIRLQRRKRYRNRPLGGYKTLVTGKLDMAQVLQRSFSGMVRLFHEKQTEHQVEVMVGSLTSTPGEYQVPNLLAEVWSDEDEDDVFSDELGERASDSESGDNMEQPSFNSKRKTKLTPSAAVLRLLRLHRRSKGGMSLSLGLQTAEGEVRETAVSFASSISDSEEEEEEEELEGDSQSKPKLSPFFGSDHCSLLSLPTSGRASENVGGGGLENDVIHEEHGMHKLKKYGSLEQAFGLERITTPPPIFTMGEETLRQEWDLEKGRVWVGSCEGNNVQVAKLLSRLETSGEVTVMCEGVTSEGVMRNALSIIYTLLSTIDSEWQDQSPFHVILLGGDGIMSAAVQSLVSSKCSYEKIQFSFISTTPGIFAANMWKVDDHFQSTFRGDGQWMSGGLQDSIALAMNYVAEANHCVSLQLSEAVLQRDGGQEPLTLPVAYNVSVGVLEAETEPQSGPTSPSNSSSESTELVVEYGASKKEGQKGSIKVRSVQILCAGKQFNVTATGKDKKGKGIRIRKKDPEAGGASISFSASQIVCRPTSKQETVTVLVDGVEWEGVTNVRLTAVKEPSQTFPVAVTMATTTENHS